MRIKNHYTVRVESKREDSITMGSFKMELPKLSQRIEDSGGDGVSYNPDFYITKHGVVEDIAFVDEDEKEGFVNEGFPPPTYYISSDMISLYNKEKMAYEQMGQDDYNPSIYEMERTNALDIYGTESQVGDKVYFHHTQITEGNKLEENLYLVDFMSIVAFERDSVLYATKGYVLLERKPKDDNVAGIMIVNDGKFVENTGIVLNSGVGSKVACGDEVVFKPKSDYPIDIQEKRVYASKESDLLCAIN